MHVAIMQPYFLPYLGYYQLVAAVDRFVIYDTVEYTKKGWINRNRMLRNGEPVTFSLPLKKASDHLQIRDRELAGDYRPEKIINKFEGAYRKAPQFSSVMPLLHRILNHPSKNLFEFLYNSLTLSCQHLGLATPLVVASQVEVGPPLRGSDRVLSICAALGATRYTNAIGGLDLYRASVFSALGIELKFLRCQADPYPQGGFAFIPNLSIVDVMMYNSTEQVKKLLATGYDLIDGND